MDQADSRVLTIMLSAMRGAGEVGARATRSDALAWAEKHKLIVVPAMQKHGGRLVKSMGDTLALIFDSATDAALAGAAVQDELVRYNSYKALSDRLELRVLINVGEVTLLHDDIIGEPVSVAAALVGLAEPGEVFLTESAQLSMNKVEISSGEVGLFDVPGSAEKIKLYKLLREAGAPEAPRTGPVKAVLKRMPKLPLHIPFAGRRMMTAGATLLVLGGMILFNYRRPARVARETTSVAAPLSEEKIDQGACQEDLKKFCPGIPHGGGKQAECLRDHLSELTRECTEHGFMRDYAAKHPAWAKEHGMAPPADWDPTAVDPELSKVAYDICDKDVRKFCATVTAGQGHVFNCLWEQKSELESACRQACEPLWQKALAAKK